VVNSQDDHEMRIFRGVNTARSVFVVARHPSRSLCDQDGPDDGTGPCNPLAIYRSGASKRSLADRITLDDAWYMGSASRGLVAFGDKPADPPVLLGHVLWMFIRVLRQLHSRTRTLFRVAGIALGV
jgi:hypothetical protein